MESVPCVCLCVCLSALLWLNCSSYGPKIRQEHCARICSKVKVIGQRSRSPFWKTWFSDFFLWCDLCRLHAAILSWHLTSCDVTARRHDVRWRHSVTSWHPLTTFGHEYWQREHILRGCVNAQAFSFVLFLISLSYACYIPAWMVLVVNKILWNGPCITSILRPPAYPLTSNYACWSKLLEKTNYSLS